MIIRVSTKSTKRRKLSAKRKFDIVLTQQINDKYRVDETKLKYLPNDQYKLQIPEDRKHPDNVKSHQPIGGDTTKPKPCFYTGDKIIGIAVMHKSNLVPVFSEQQATDITNMRR